jgi:hypothetical protein
LGGTVGGTQNLPPDLRLIVEAWPKLPKAVRAGIVAMVRAAKGERKGR